MCRGSLEVIVFVAMAMSRIASASAPSVTTELDPREVFVGEAPPLVTVVIAAPADGQVLVLRKERIHAAYKTAVYDADEKALPVNSPQEYIYKELAEDDYVKLPAGKTAQYTFELPERSLGVGTFRIRGTFIPTPDRSLKFDFDLPFDCIEIAKESITRKTRIPVITGEHIEVMSIKHHDEHLLVYRLLNPNDGVFYTSRLGEVDRESPIVVKPTHFLKHDWTSDARITIRFSRGGKEQSVVTDWLGSVFDKGQLGSAETKAPPPAAP